MRLGKRVSGCDCTLNSMGLVRMCGSVNTSFSAMALDSVAQFLKESNSILIIIILVINVFKKKFIVLYLGRKNNSNSKTISRLCTMSQYKLWKETMIGINTRTKDATILNAGSGKCEAIPRATVPQSCTW